MKNKPVSPNSNYKNLVTQISETYAHGFRKAVAAVNSNMVETNWKIGQYIVDYEQGGSFKAIYGKALLENLATDLTRLHGKGFSRSDLNYMRLFYLHFPICETVSHKLNWSQLFVNKYQLYLPNKEELQQLIENQLKDNNNQNQDLQD